MAYGRYFLGDDLCGFKWDRVLSDRKGIRDGQFRRGNLCLLAAAFETFFLTNDLSSGCNVLIFILNIFTMYKLMSHTGTNIRQERPFYDPKDIFSDLNSLIYVTQFKNLVNSIMTVSVFIDYVLNFSVAPESLYLYSMFIIMDLLAKKQFR